MKHKYTWKVRYEHFKTKRKNASETFSVVKRQRTMMLKAILILIAANSALALRFAHFPVTVDTDVLVVGKPSKLTCNYVKFRIESVREITWFAGYNGMKMKIFSYNVGTEEKEGSSYSYIKTDESSATDNSLIITLPEFRESTLTIGCEVQILRDSGSGSVRHSKKYKEVPRVINNLFRLKKV